MTPVRNAGRPAPAAPTSYFSDDAIALVHQLSPGLPRAVNNLAVQVLVAAFARNKSLVDDSSA